MRTTLYIFALLWFLSGVVLVMLGTTLETLPLLPALASTTETIAAHPVFGNARIFLIFALALLWTLIFCIPALLLAALGAMLQRLDSKAMRAAGPGAERVAPLPKRHAAEKMEPHIGRV